MRITLTPRVLLVALLGIPLLLIAPHWATVLVCTVALLTVLLIDVLAAGSPRRLRVTRESPSTTRLGTTGAGRLLLTNPMERTVRLQVRDPWNPTAGLSDQRSRPVVPPGERRAVPQSFTPVRRGRHTSPGPTIALTGPMGLTRRVADLPVPGAFLALHAFPARRHLPARLRRLREIEGLAAVHHRGPGTEFDSLKEFVDGDDVRSIDWRATARGRTVVVRTWRPERDRRILLVLDTSRTAAARIGDAPRLDAAIDAALLLTALAAAAGDRVDVLCADRIPHASVEGSPARTVLHDVITTVSPVQAALVETDWEMIAAQVHRRTRRGDLVVLLAPVEAAEAGSGMLPVVARIAADHPLVVASVEDPSLAELAAERGDVRAAYRAAAAAASRVERGHAAQGLERAGAVVVDAGPEDLPQRLADQYLALKAAGRL
ncbi:DUF58 domain-containing protein [Brachybacterium sp. EF45031]|uniref:DUF58 domain-containing protein n=1 Tax=Brachybacterium sillae TaxID=2810536 RepID=UPI00217D81E5|nr:DUF58 domain-containing protein [Brachybacterium sillae]MCS6711017.1 DUF58 domain-containing protein [Brachybacterium sillae]